MGTVPQFLTHICCGQMAGWIKMPLGMEVGLGRGDFVLDGVQLPLPEKGAEPPPHFCGPCPLWPNDWMDQNDTWHGGGPWSRPHCARWGCHPAPLHKMGTELLPKFSASFYCGQTAGCIKMPLGTPQPRRLYVRWGPSPLLKKGAEPPIFGPCLL